MTAPKKKIGSGQEGNYSCSQEPNTIKLTIIVE